MPKQTMKGRRRSGGAFSLKKGLYGLLVIAIGFVLAFCVGIVVVSRMKPASPVKTSGQRMGVESLRWPLRSVQSSEVAPDNRDEPSGEDISQATTKYTGDDVPPGQADALASEDLLQDDQTDYPSGSSLTLLKKSREGNGLSRDFLESVVRASASWPASLAELAFGDLADEVRKTAYSGKRETENPEADPLWRVLSTAAELLLPSDETFAWSMVKGHPFFVDRDSRFIIQALTENGINAKRTWGKKPVKSDAVGNYRFLFCYCMGDICPSYCVDGRTLTKLLPSQRINRIPGLRNTLWLKHRFCLTASAAIREYRESLTPAEEDAWLFLFDCYILPSHMENAVTVADREANSNSTIRWIMKPTHRGEGAGIQLMDSMREVLDFYKSAQTISGAAKAHIASSTRDSYRNLPAVVQPYLSSNHLIEGRKFDLRTYVLVTSISPLRAYIYTRGLVRFAADKYEEEGDPNEEGKEKEKMKKTQFLTNTSVGKSKQSLASLTWSFAELRKYWKKKGINPDVVFRRVHRAITLMLMGGEPQFLKTQQSLKDASISAGSFFQVLGVDVIFDGNLNPKIIEVNGEPSMLNSDAWFRTTHYDETKRRLSFDIVKLLSYKSRSKHQLEENLLTARRSIYSGLDYMRNIVRLRSVDCDSELRRIDGSLPSLDEMKAVLSGAASSSQSSSMPPIFCLNDEEVLYLIRAHLEKKATGGFWRIYPYAYPSAEEEPVGGYNILRDKQTERFLKFVADKSSYGSRNSYSHPVLMALLHLI